MRPLVLREIADTARDCTNPTVSPGQRRRSSCSHRSACSSSSIFFGKPRWRTERGRARRRPRRSVALIKQTGSSAEKTQRSRLSDSKIAQDARRTRVSWSRRPNHREVQRVPADTPGKPSARLSEGRTPQALAGVHRIPNQSTTEGGVPMNLTISGQSRRRLPRDQGIRG